MNIWMVSGNMGKDPELQVTAKGTAVTKFSVATTRWNGTEEETQWVNVVCWGKTAENVEMYARKGAHVDVVGECITRKYTGKDGVERLAVELNASRVEWKNNKPRPNSAGAVPTVDDAFVPDWDEEKAQV